MQMRQKKKEVKNNLVLVCKLVPCHKVSLAVSEPPATLVLSSLSVIAKLLHLASLTISAP